MTTTDEVFYSEAQGMAQEQGGETGVERSLSAASSETDPVVQEAQRNAKPAISPEEERRRLEQSLRDRIRHEERLALQREIEERQRREAEERERQRLAEMDDEDYGRYMRAKEREQALKQSALIESFRLIEREALAAIESDSVRQKIAEKLANGEFKSFREFQNAIVKAEAEELAARQLRQREKEIREAAQNGRIADLTELAPPQTGIGVPTGALNLNKMSARDLIRLGTRLKAQQKRE